PVLESGNDDLNETDEFQDNDDEYDDYDNEQIDAEDINIDDYISDDEIPDYKLKSNNYSDDDEETFMPIEAQISFHQSLIEQLNTFILTDEERTIAEFLIGSMDDMGYIRRDIQDIVDDMAFTQGIYSSEEQVQDILE